MPQSSDVLSIEKIANDRARITDAVRRDYANWRSQPERFAGYTEADINEERNRLLVEVDHYASLATMAALEAAFRGDYERRCMERLRDPLSRFFRDIRRRRRTPARFSEDILEGWKQHGNVSAKFIGEINAALRYRHWLAHGRYWKPQLGRRFDYQVVFDIASAAQESLSLRGRSSFGISHR